jgi:hypothetical protein
MERGRDGERDCTEINFCNFSLYKESIHRALLEHQKNPSSFCSFFWYIKFIKRKEPGRLDLSDHKGQPTASTSVVVEKSLSTRNRSR